MTKLVILALLLLIGCADSPAPSKGQPVNTCVDLGCQDQGDGLCTRSGRCTCNGEACQREHGLSFVDAGAPVDGQPVDTN